MADINYVSGVQQLQRRIATIRERLSLPPMVDEIGELLLRRTMIRFDREIDPMGSKWQVLAPITQHDKIMLGYSKGILRRTDEMRNSIKLIRGAVGGSVFTNTGAGIRIGVTGSKEVVRKAMVHNKGLSSSRKVWGRIPARRFLGIGPLDIRAVDSFMRRRAERAMESK